MSKSSITVERGCHIPLALHYEEPLQRRRFHLVYSPGGEAAGLGAWGRGHFNRRFCSVYKLRTNLVKGLFTDQVQRVYKIIYNKIARIEI